MEISNEKEHEKKDCIVVDEKDNFISIENIKKCHIFPGICHRAFSVLIYDNENKILLQQRAKTKYTFPLNWTNSVCSHPRSEKHDILYYVVKRIKEELGIIVDENKLKYITKIKYKSRSDLIWCENEIDYVYICKINIKESDINFDKDEINQIKFVTIHEIKEMLESKLLFSPWFRYLFNNLDLEYDNIINYNSNLKDIGDLSFFNINKKYLIYAPYYYLNSNSGKKIRDLITDSVCSYYKLSNQELNIIKTVVNEIHNSSLLFDDVQDESKYRRGAKCAHLLYGTPLTINSSLFQLMESVYKVPDKVKKIVLKSIMDLLDGQGADIYFTENKHVLDINNYISIIEGKTSALFTLPLKMANAFNSNQNIFQEKLELYHEIGILFQKRDDYINVISSKYWKKKGFFQDFEEKKYGHPLVVYCEKGNTYIFKEEYSFEIKYDLYLSLHQTGTLKEVYKDLKSKHEEIKGKVKDNIILTRILSNIMDIEEPVLYSKEICFKYEKIQV